MACPDPAAKLSTDVIYDAFQCNVFFVINGLNIFCEPYENSEHIHFISPENLFSAWTIFKQDKQKRADVLVFERSLEQNIFQLYRDLKYHRYRHGEYFSFYIRDPKVRHIHKATVRDRVLHHAIFAVLNPVFEPTFIANSFSCRIGKGNHKGVDVLGKMIRIASHNFTKPCFVLKCDIRKFFETVDHDRLIGILARRIKDDNATQLIREIIGSFSSSYSTLFEKRGLPIGNLTSQLFANIYLNDFDQFVKQKLCVKYYKLRHCVRTGRVSQKSVLVPPQ